MYADSKYFECSQSKRCNSVREREAETSIMPFSCFCAAGLEADAEACERKELGDARKAEEANRRADEARKKDKEERDALKDKIVGRYADEVKVCVCGDPSWHLVRFGTPR